MGHVQENQSCSESPLHLVAALERPLRSSRRRFFTTPKTQLSIVICATIAVAAVIDHWVADWIDLRRPLTTYRRIGPQNGPQVFAAGSSLLQFALSWRDVSEALGQGIETWGVPGSSPSEWEISQAEATNTNIAIIGVSPYDLNEHHVCDVRANVVPVGLTVSDLWSTHTEWQFSERLLAQYPLIYVRKLFPTAGRSDSFLVGVRRKFRQLLRRSPGADDRAIDVGVPNQPILEFPKSKDRISEWPLDRISRRVALMVRENRGLHDFNGPKKMAFDRILIRAQQRGRVIVVVLPVSPAYSAALLRPDVLHKFEKALAEARRVAPQTQLMRLDQLPALQSNDYYSDLAHLNGEGRRIATEAFLKWLKGTGAR
jgi:hypothetical protein